MKNLILSTAFQAARFGSNFALMFFIAGCAAVVTHCFFWWFKYEFKEELKAKKEERKRRREMKKQNKAIKKSQAKFN